MNMKNLKEREALCSVSVWQSTHQINLGKRKKIQELLTHAGVKIWIRERNGYMLGVYSPSEQAIQDQSNLVQYKTLSQRGSLHLHLERRKKQVYKVKIF